jgi:hypothetical protein
MNTDKLSGLIRRKNERLEEEALGQAEDLISKIVKEQERIKASEARIVELRDELKALEVEQIDQSAVLGGGV